MHDFLCWMPDGTDALPRAMALAGRARPASGALPLPLELQQLRDRFAGRAAVEVCFDPDRMRSLLRVRIADDQLGAVAPTLLREAGVTGLSVLALHQGQLHLADGRIVGANGPLARRDSAVPLAALPLTDKHQRAHIQERLAPLFRPQGWEMGSGAFAFQRRVPAGLWRFCLSIQSRITFWVALQPNFANEVAEARQRAGDPSFHLSPEWVERTFGRTITTASVRMASTRYMREVDVDSWADMDRLADELHAQWSAGLLDFVNSVTEPSQVLALATGPDAHLGPFCDMNGPDPLGHGVLSGNHADLLLARQLGSPTLPHLFAARRLACAAKAPRSLQGLDALGEALGLPGPATA